MKKTIWGNCIIKNEDKYVWFAIKSVINHLDKLIIYDTGSIDQTVKIIDVLKEEHRDKIIFEEKGSVDPAGLTRLRQEMLDKTKSDWLLLLDGDEVWWEDSIKKTISEINQLDQLYALVNPTINLVGDIFHYQEEEAGEYKILGKKGHFNIRAINRGIPGLHLKNVYPLEGFFDGEGILIQNSEEKLRFIDAPILHLTFLQRSGKDDKTTLHRDKVKLEIGKIFRKGFKYPEVFYIEKPVEVSDPFLKMGLSYKLKASVLTPLKKLKRRLSK